MPHRASGAVALKPHPASLGAKGRLCAGQRPTTVPAPPGRAHKQRIPAPGRDRKVVLVRNRPSPRVAELSPHEHKTVVAALLWPRPVKRFREHEHGTAFGTH
jgi:hypothetical protein